MLSLGASRRRPKKQKQQLQESSQRISEQTSCGERTWFRIPAVAGISNTPIGDALPTGRFSRTGVATNSSIFANVGTKEARAILSSLVWPSNDRYALGGEAKEGTCVSCPSLFSRRNESYGFSPCPRRTSLHRTNSSGRCAC